MKNIETNALLEYSPDQLYEVIDDCDVYDMPTVLYVYGICHVDEIEISKDRMRLMDSRFDETGFKSFKEYVKDLVKKKGVKNIGEYLDIVPEGYVDQEDSSNEFPIENTIADPTQSTIYPTIDKLFQLVDFLKVMLWILIIILGIAVVVSFINDGIWQFLLSVEVSLLVIQFIAYLQQEFAKVFVDIGLNSHKTNLLLKQILESKDNDDRKRD